MTLKVVLTSGKKQYAYGEPIVLSARLTNTGRSGLNVVRDEPTASVEGQTINLLVGRSIALGRLTFFAFQAPRLQALGPGASITTRFRIGMPIDEAQIDAAGRANLVEIPLAGRVGITLRVGYLQRPFKPLTSDPYGEFVRVQRLARSNRLPISVAPP